MDIMCHDSSSGKCRSTTALTMVIPLSAGTNPCHGAGMLELLSTLVTLMVIPEMIFYVMIMQDTYLSHIPTTLEIFQPGGMRTWVSANALGAVSSLATSTGTRNLTSYATMGKMARSGSFMQRLRASSKTLSFGTNP